MKNVHALLAVLLLCVGTANAQEIITTKKVAGSFALVSPTDAPAIIYDAADDSLVHRTAMLFQSDVVAVSGKTLPLATSIGGSKTVILIGSLQRSGLIQQLVKEKKLDVSRIRNKWEGYQVQLVKAPFKGVTEALVIAGSDRRGTAFGVFELSKQMGVSPWHWWADVPVKKKEAIYIRPSAFLTDAPKVKYRGIFINDEAPALSGWSRSTFGGFNHRFYEKVFQLMLRLKANYLWPAMWGNAFYDDDKQNRQTADNYGIVIGTSHHEPLMRAHDEWRRYGKGKWDYTKNEEKLRQFWKEGMQRATNEKIVSVGMRGDGDEPMTEETATALLERIVKDQRQIIEEVTGKPAAQTPQLWALYKEVQDYYDKGMRVPDDVTLLLCDDNWGNIRKLPKLNENKRSGGYGIYYHFDYVGGPRNYKWLNTNNLARVWEQMNLAYRYGADRIWIVNVGDIKPMELPISFFLDQAWNPEKWNESNVRDFYTQWAAQQFGEGQAATIGDILRRYSQYSARRKPELLDADTYRLSTFADDDEWGRVTKEWNQLFADAEKVNALLPAEQKDAFFQLVWHPVKAFTNLHQLYAAVAQNRLHAGKNSPLANDYAKYAQHHYNEDSLLTIQYHSIANGKWKHMMSQTHIGYTYWQQPEVNKMPEVKWVENGEESLPEEYQLLTSAKDKIPATAKGNVFYEENGVVSIEAEHWTRANHSKAITWKVIPDIGRTGSGITTFPVTASTTLSATSPHVAYEFYSLDSGAVTVNLYFSPTLNFHNNEGLKFAVSIDNEKPQIFSLNKEDKEVKTWESWVADNIILKTSRHAISRPGKHTLKYWVVSPAVILQKAVIDFGGLKKSYLGPQETKK